jgi:hypothetical protein
VTVKDLWFSPGTPVSSTNKTDRLDIAEILLNVALNTIYHKTIYSNVNQPCLKEVGTARMDNPETLDTMGKQE